jgi:hypothetical protein
MDLSKILLVSEFRNMRQYIDVSPDGSNSGRLRECSVRLRAGSALHRHSSELLTQRSGYDHVYLVSKRKWTWVTTCFVDELLGILTKFASKSCFP